MLTEGLRTVLLGVKPVVMVQVLVSFGSVHLAQEYVTPDAGEPSNVTEFTRQVKS